MKSSAGKVSNAERRMQSLFTMTSDDRPMKQAVIQANAPVSLKKSRVAELGANRGLCTVVDDVNQTKQHEHE
jgi:hypothetical protein